MAEITLEGEYWRYFQNGDWAQGKAIGYKLDADTQTGIRCVGRCSFTAPEGGAKRISIYLDTYGLEEGADIPLRFFIGSSPTSHMGAGPDSEYTGVLTPVDPLVFTASADVSLLPNRTYYLWVFPGEESPGIYGGPDEFCESTVTTYGVFNTVDRLYVGGKVVKLIYLNRKLIWPREANWELLFLQEDLSAVSAPLLSAVEALGLYEDSSIISRESAAMNACPAVVLPGDMHSHSNLTAANLNVPVVHMDIDIAAFSELTADFTLYGAVLMDQSTDHATTDTISAITPGAVHMGSYAEDHGSGFTGSLAIAPGMVKLDALRDSVSGLEAAGPECYPFLILAVRSNSMSDGEQCMTVEPAEALRVENALASDHQIRAGIFPIVPEMAHREDHSTDAQADVQAAPGVLLGDLTDHVSRQDAGVYVASPVPLEAEHDSLTTEEAAISADPAAFLDAEAVSQTQGEPELTVAETVRMGSLLHLRVNLEASLTVAQVAGMDADIASRSDTDAVLNFQAKEVVWYAPVQEGTNLYIRSVWLSWSNGSSGYIDTDIWYEVRRNGSDLYIRSVWSSYQDRDKALIDTDVWYEVIREGSNLHIRSVDSSYQDREQAFIDLSLWLAPIQEGDNLHIRSADTVWTDGESANVDTEFFLNPVQEGTNLHIRQNIFGGA